MVTQLRECSSGTNHGGFGGGYERLSHQAMQASRACTSSELLGKSCAHWSATQTNERQDSNVVMKLETQIYFEQL